MALNAPQRPRFTVHSRLKSFGFAFKGLRYLLATEHNMWIHLAATFVVVAGGFWFGVSQSDWLWLVAAICSVWTAEAFNTAIERLADAVTQERDARIGIVKDCAAAGVLVAAIGAALIGLIVFLPHLGFAG